LAGGFRWNKPKVLSGQYIYLLFKCSILFEKINNNVIYSGNDAGDQLQITTSAQIVWRPRKNTQSKIAFIRSSGYAKPYYTMNPDGSEFLK
jgi:hypothetical protein